MVFLNESKVDHVFKIILVGESGVGKSNLLTRLTSNNFDTNSQTTVGVDFRTKIVNINKERIKARIWDTAGQERFRAIIRTYYTGADGIILIYDITKYETFEKISYWLKEIENNADRKPVVMLIGNKTDLNDLREVSVNEGETFAKSNNMLFIEISTKNSTNVQQSLKMLLIEIHKLAKNRDEISDVIKMPKNGLEEKRKKRCC